MSTKARAFQQACRTQTRLNPSPQRSLRATQHRHVKRRYATHSSSGSGKNLSRRAVTVTSDDGRYDWSELSTGEKAARTTQQTFNLALVAAGLGGTCLVSYFLYQELFAADSKTVQFNHATDRVKASPKCRSLLGPAKKIIAYGESTTSKWARARPLAYQMDTDKFGTTHFRMHFNVEGPEGSGVVNVHMTKPHDADRLEYRLLSLNVPGHEVVYLENKDNAGVKEKVGKMLGVQWRGSSTRSGPTKSKPLNRDRVWDSTGRFAEKSGK